MRFRSLALAMALAATTPVFAADDVLQQADTLLRQQQAAQAYDLLAPLEDERAGDPKYDYLFGVALLETGDPSRAIFAFERCLAVEPNNGPCRVQMARTHLAIGEAPNARAELETIKEYNPPPEVQSLISQYLGVIDRVEKRQKRNITAYAQIGAGYDSNINSATDNSRIAIPTNNGSTLFLTVPSSEDSGYGQLQAGAAMQYKVTPTTFALADANVLYRGIQSNHDFDYQTADASLGGAFTVANTQLIAKLQGQKMWLDAKAYRDVSGALVQAQRGLTETAQMAAFSQLSKIRFDTQKARDADRLTIGLAYSQAFDGAMSPTMYASVYGGNEDTVHDQFDFFGQSFTGVRTGGNLVLTPKLGLNGNLSYEQRDYDAINPFLPFKTERKEKVTDVHLGLNWQLQPGLRLQPGYSFTNNNSNLPTDEYQRHVVSVDLRCDL